MDAETLAALGQRLSRYPPASPEAELADAITGVLLGRQDSLDAALGLAGGPRRERAATAWRRAQRDAWLRTAIDLCEGETPWRRCLSAEREINTFLSCVWPHWRAKDRPPVGASELRSALFFAAKMGQLPRTARQLSNVRNM